MGSSKTSTKPIADPPSELFDFVKRHIRNCRVDRRGAPDTLHLAKVLVQPVDEDYRTLGEPFACVTRNLEPTQISLVVENSIEQRLLALQMTSGGEVSSVVCEVESHRPLGPYILVEGKLVARLDDFPQQDGETWFLAGRIQAGGSLCDTPVDVSPFTIGRRKDVSLHLPSRAVSGLHAEIFEREEALYLRDLGSTNGTFVNGEVVQQERMLCNDDHLQFGDVTMRVRCRSIGRSTSAAIECVWDEAIALARFDELMSNQAVACNFQPIVRLSDGMSSAYEALPHSRLIGLRTPGEMFEAAARLDAEAQLGELLRRSAVALGQRLPPSQRLFVAVHPKELAETDELLASIEALRRKFPEPQLALQIHETEATDLEMLRSLRSALREFGACLVYGGFTANRTRLEELAQAPPDVLRFDTAFIRSIHAAEANQQQAMAEVVHMAHELSITTLADGVEIKPEIDICRKLGFDFAQGLFFGKPAAAEAWNSASPQV